MASDANFHSDYWKQHPAENERENNALPGKKLMAFIYEGRFGIRNIFLQRDALLEELSSTGKLLLSLSNCVLHCDFSAKDRAMNGTPCMSISVHCCSRKQ